jgi:hypothetical protein
MIGINKPLVALLFALAVRCTIFAEAADRLAERLMNARLEQYPQVRAGIDRLPADERIAVVEYLRVVRQGSRGEYRGTLAAIALLKLGDVETTKEILSAHRGSDYSAKRESETVLRMSLKPSLIAELAQDLNKEEDTKPIVHGDVVYSSLSIGAAEKIVEKLILCPEFSDPVRTWARQIRHDLLLNDVELRLAIREFWKLNETSFRNKDYAAVVVPGSTAPEPTPQPHATPCPAPTPEPAAAPAREMPSRPEPSGVAPSEPTAKKSGIARLFLAGIAIGAVTLVVFAARIFRK